MSDKESLENNKVSFKDTLNLPHTEFPIRANAAVEEPKIVARWEQENLAAATMTCNKNAERFVLHDGPPYANGPIHLGHAYNKILKDIVTKSRRMAGNFVPAPIPGWDCHGLPIELAVAKEHPHASRTELKKACRVYAQRWIEAQAAQFKQLGVLMDFDHPYTTMSFEYQAAIVRAFGNFVADGNIERKNKTVPWCASCQTVLASAEIEYQDRKDPSIYVAFELEKERVNELFPQLQGAPVSLLVWTTTPWTLPLNRAVLLKPAADYVVLQVKDQYVVVGKQLAGKICSLLESSVNIVAECKAELLQGARVHHPFVAGLVVPIILDDSVLLEDGTACVHCAPGCGPEDYEVGVKNGLDVFAPVGPDGCYTAGIAPKELEGMPVADGQIWVIKTLAASGKLIFKNNITHSYPHCWRCRKGLIFRATKQWFCNLKNKNLKNRALEQIKSIEFYPENSANRLSATIESRWEWCLSRQRVWGSPIVALRCASCDHAYTSQELINKVAHEIQSAGIEAWDDIAIADLLPAGHACTECGGTQFEKEQDILDVWFDSGVSHDAVYGADYPDWLPVDMYLEGRDQHRGWFQSSLLVGTALRNKTPMKRILTHGYTVDDKGRKMSKSLGNGVEPQEMIDRLGVDGLRLWVSAIDYAGDVVVSDVLLNNVQEVFRKIRNTARFLLSNLNDFNVKNDAVAFESLRMIDRHALEELALVNEKVVAAYERFDFTAVFHELADYCSVQLSSYYLDIIKDRLYVEKADGVARRSAQTVTWLILDSLTKLMAPIMSITAEQIADNYQDAGHPSILLQGFNRFNAEKSGAVLNIFGDAWQPGSNVDAIVAREAEINRWEFLNKLRSVILKGIEQLRERKIIKHSLEAAITLHIDERSEYYDLFSEFLRDLATTNQTFEEFLKEYVIVSQVAESHKLGTMELTELDGVWLHVQQAAGEKCPRCWHWETTSHEHKLCARCQDVLKI